jgi:UDP-N-acetylmuramoylalanine--D-glutamate ligase
VAEYLEAKKRIFMNQDETDWLVLNHGDEALRGLGAEAASRVIFFNKEASEGAFNQNQLAVLAVAQALGVDRQICLEVFRRFRGVEHRMELVRTLRGVDFINDSKATNIDSTVWALNNISKRAVLIAGGRDKGSDFGSLRELVARKVRVAVLVGEASDRIAQAWEGTVPVKQVGSFEEAVTAASREAREGEIVLLSPMCKSFDLFTDYEHRGRTFKDLVSRLS